MVGLESAMSALASCIRPESSHMYSRARWWSTGGGGRVAAATEIAERKEDGWFLGVGG
jgi:hypothetical protein